MSKGILSSTVTDRDETTGHTERAAAIEQILARIERLRHGSTSQYETRDTTASPMEGIMALASVVAYVGNRTVQDVLALMEIELRRDRTCSISQAAHRVEGRLLGVGRGAHPRRKTIAIHTNDHNN